MYSVNAFRFDEMRDKLVELHEAYSVDFSARIHEMHMLMLGDPDINGGPVTLKINKRNEDGSWDKEVGGMVPEERKVERKKELLVDLATRADIDDVLTEDALTTYGTPQEEPANSTNDDQ